jgi:hypothetical protein
MTEDHERGRVLYVVVCAAPPASEVHELVKLAQVAGWEVCVIVTPEAMHWIDPAMLAELTGYDVRSEYGAAGEAKSLTKVSETELAWIAAERALAAAERAEERLGDDRNDFWFAFGPTNVRIHAVALAVEVGDPNETIRLGESLDTSRLPAGVRGRRSAVLIDLARGYAMRRMDAAAVNTLLDAEQVAPEAVRFNVIVHELLRELLKREHRATTPQLRPLAERAGVLSDSSRTS